MSASAPSTNCVARVDEPSYTARTVIPGLSCMNMLASSSKDSVSDTAAKIVSSSVAGGRSGVESKADEQAHKTKTNTARASVRIFAIIRMLASRQTATVCTMSLPPLVQPGPPLSADETARFSRHVLLREIGEEGQRRLLAARVCVIGAGGLGSPALLYLAAAGVGHIGIVDEDAVEPSNLQRQVIHGRDDVGGLKVISAANSIGQLAPSAKVTTYSERLTAVNAARILEGWDIVLDGTDNFDTRYLVADTCAELKIPLVWASILRFDAQLSVFWDPPDGSGVPGVHLRDLFPDPPDVADGMSCSTSGVLGALCGQVGSTMAVEAVKLIVGIGEPLLGRVLVLDALSARWTEVPLRPSGLRDRPERQPGHARTANAAETRSGELSAKELQERLDARDRGHDAFTLIDVRDPEEHAAGAIGGSVLHPLAELLTENGRSHLPGDTPFVLYCARGPRADRAAFELAQAGFTNVVTLRGGFESWLRYTAVPTP